MNMTRLALLAPGLALAIGLAGCAERPAERLYVLSPQLVPVAHLQPTNTANVLHLQAVSIPDDLDTTDILLRVGPHELKASRTGAWAERLSIGVTRALAASLAQRLPTDTITQGPAIGPKSRQIVVDIDGFDVHPDGRCVLAARWAVLQSDNTTVITSGDGVFSADAPVGDATLNDGRIVAGMLAVLAKLADRVAGSV